MQKNNLFYRIFDLYYDGFRHMRIGKTLWTVILVKLFVIFVILKLFFFPNFLKRHATNGDNADYVSRQMIERSQK